MSTGHYFDPVPRTSSARRTVTLSLPDLSVELITDRGVFSAVRVDSGTKVLLLEAPDPPDHGAVLDLGCGYGPIAVVLARRAPGASVWAVDVNERARALTALNAAAAGLTNVSVAAPEEVPPELRFAAIYSNPPVRIGKAALHQLLRRWLDRLEPDGVAHLVVNKNLGADSLATWMADGLGWAVDRQVSRVGYRVLTVRPTDHPPGPAAAAHPRDWQRPVP